MPCLGAHWIERPSLDVGRHGRQRRSGTQCCYLILVCTFLGTRGAPFNDPEKIKRRHAHVAPSLALLVFFWGVVCGSICFKDLPGGDR